MSAMDEIKRLDYSIVQSSRADRMPVDFTIEDEAGNTIASVWGAKSNDVDWECSHPDECVEYDDDETVGECMLCGSHCDWHYEADGGNVGDYYWEGKTRRPHEWYPQRDVGGLVKGVVEELDQGGL